jgi:hypothetical protein
MSRKVIEEPPAGSPANPIPLPRSKKTLERYYVGRRLGSPMGGQLDVLGVRDGANGTGRVMLECNSSSLRFVLVIPRASKTEKAEVQEVLERGDDPHCPRHGPSQRLTKSGKNLVCPLCGVAFGKI